MSDVDDLSAGADSEDSGPEAFAKEADEALDAAIAEMIPPDEDEDDLHVAEAGKPKKKKGKGSSEDDDEDEDGEPEPDDEDDEDEGKFGEDLEDSDGDEDDEGDEDDDDEDMALHRAYTTLHAAGIPSKVLKRTPKAELIAWAKRVDQKGEANGTASSGAERGRETASGANPVASEPASASGPVADWATTRAGLAKSFGIDEESVDGLKPMHDALLAAHAEIKALRAEHEQDRLASREREGRTLIDKETRRLERKYPGLRADPDRMEALTSTALSLLKDRRARTVTEAFDKAAKAELGRARRSDLAQLRRNGSSTPPERRGGYDGAAALPEDKYWERAMELSYQPNGRQRISRLKPPEPKRRQRSAVAERILRTRDE